MENLLDYMLLFRLQPGTPQPKPQQLTAIHEQWSKFIGAIASQARLVSTNRLSFEGNIINKDLSISNGINITNNEILSGNMVIKASSLIEATEMAKDCPVLAMGGSVEVRAILPMQP